MENLYPITIAQLDQIIAVPNQINQGSMWCVPITLEAGTANTIVALQASVTEDFSIRSWFSLQPNANSLFLDNEKAFFNLLRIPTQLVMYDQNYAPPQLVNPKTQYQILFPLQPGNYYMNFLNLINQKNVFTFAINVVELTE